MSVDDAFWSVSSPFPEITLTPHVSYHLASLGFTIFNADFSWKIMGSSVGVCDDAGYGDSKDGDDDDDDGRAV